MKKSDPLIQVHLELGELANLLHYSALDPRDRAALAGAAEVLQNFRTQPVDHVALSGRIRALDDELTDPGLTALARYKLAGVRQALLWLHSPASTEAPSCSIIRWAPTQFGIGADEGDVARGATAHGR